MALLLYLGLVALIVLTVQGVFNSATGQLSLSKMQMGIWTFVFGLCYVLIAAIRWEFLDITEGMFWLMGISSATAVGAKAVVIKNQTVPIAAQRASLEAVLALQNVDASKNKRDAIDAAKPLFKAVERTATLTGDETVAKAVNSAMQVTKKAKSTKEDVCDAAHEAARAAAKVAPPPSELLRDWDFDSEKCLLSLHRCQIAIWTLIVLVIYVIKFIGTMHLQDIPPQLLVLMGISGGTYLGFNYPKAK